MTSTTTNWLWGLGALVGAGALVGLSRLSRLSQEFILESESRIHSVSLTEVVIAVDITFKNPTDAEITLLHPTVKLFASPEALAANQHLVSSVVQGHRYRIAPQAETKLQPVLIRLPLSLNTFLAGYGWVKTYLMGLPVHLIARATTTVNGSIPVVKLMPVSLQKNAPLELFLSATTYGHEAGMRVRTRLMGSNRRGAQQVTTRIAVYATEGDRAVDAPLWVQQNPLVTVPANRAGLVLAHTDGVIPAASLKNYRGLTSVLVLATLTSGNQLAEKLITVPLPTA